MSGDDNFSLIELFREEVRAHSATLNQGLLELENDPTNPQRIEPLMRAAHSIKGAARIIGIDAAVQLAHVMEDVFVAAQEGRIQIATDDVDHLLRGTDLLATLVRVTDANANAWSGEHANDIAPLIQLFSAIAQRSPSTETPNTTSSAASPTKPQAGAPTTAVQISRPELLIPDEPIIPGDESAMFDLFREEVRVHCLILRQGIIDLATRSCTPVDVESWMHSAHAIAGAARIVGIAPAAQWAQSVEEVLRSLREAATPISAQIIDPLWPVLEALVELIRLDQQGIPEWIARRKPDLLELHDRLPEATAPPTIAPVSDALHLATPIAASSAAEPVDTPPSAVVGSAPAPATSADAADAVVRVSAQSLNRLMGLAGESLVHARWLQPFSTALLKLKKHQDHLASCLDNLAQAVTTGGDVEQVAGLITEAHRQSASCRGVLAERMGEFDDHAAQAEELNGRLYREAISSRMRPFADGAHGFPRLVRDMARQLNKHVRLDIDGLATEVDRDVLEKLEAPLTHLLRNAVDHAIESPEQRLAAGKSDIGLITLVVRHVAGMLAITIADDGAGIDLDRLRHKIVERGLATSEMSNTLTTAELLEFLFLPGFSTASALTEYSGRGVGLDVVQQTLRRIGGTVRVTTRRGSGTTFHLQMPLTLSVVRAVLVEIAGEPYAFPHNRIDRLVRVPQSELQSLENRQFVVLEGHNIGVVVAAQLMGAVDQPAFADELMVLLLSDTTGQYGLIVDAFHGEQDLVVRPLDQRLGKVPNISAAAILDDGTPVLIADVEDLVRSMDRYIQQGGLQRCARQDVAAAPKKRVLVVDDSITVREVERQILRSQGYEVTVAVDGQEAWNIVRANSFDLVISDVDMPRMNGLELVRLIRSEPSLRQLPVIIVSYKERDEDRLRGLEVGANFYLTKSSFHDNTFLQAVTDSIGKA